MIGAADAIQLASLSDSVIMVSRLQKITQSELVQAAFMLNEHKNVGLVANADGTAVSHYSSYVEDEKIVFGMS